MVNSPSAAPLHVDVAVPLPLPAPLTYRVPAAFAALARPGARARVQVGKRRLVGVIVGHREEEPPGVEVRPLEEVLDLEPILAADLLSLGRFVADYYLAPLGEVLRTMLPPDLPPWGDRKVWLTDAGAIAPARSQDEASVVEALREGGRLTYAELQRRVALPTLGQVVEDLRSAGRVAVAEGRRTGIGYVTAVELPPGDRQEQLKACGRSAPGREVVEYLASVGRPATVPEVLEAVGCARGVVRRLVSKGILRRFDQPERIPLERHLIRSPPAPGPLDLRPDQQAAVETLRAAISAAAYAPFLLTGITGSGKTEVYLRAAETALEEGRTALLLVPEIALVPVLAGEARRRFGERLAILHSTLGRPERQREWERIRRGEARVVLGARSAVFAPAVDLGLVVVDEEQDSSYKQETIPRYHARDLALVRAASHGAAAVLVSATPSLETRLNVSRRRMTALRLTTRAGGGSLPEGILVDLREAGQDRRPGEIRFSPQLREELARTLEAGDQAILLRNRRGYAPLLLCRACGEDMRCGSCGLPRTLHKRSRRLLCHYCGSTRPVPAACPSCGEAALEAIGAGTERVEERLQELFSGVAVGVLDRDSVRRAGTAAGILERFARGDTRILVGTQMVSKGHHFPRVALTAVLATDTYLGFPDFRAVERTYTLLTQLAGRAGRGERPGRVLIQTYHPEHYAIQAALSNDDARFAEEEMRFRRVFHYPPYTRMVQLLLRDKDRQRGEAAIAEMAQRLGEHRLSRGVRILGPAPAPLERLRGRWRFQLLLRAASGRQLRRLVAAALPAGRSWDLTIDVDPYQLL